MTRLKAVQRLFTGWTVYSGILLIALAGQGIAGKYGPDWVIFGYWGLALVAGPIAILGPAAFGNTKGAWKDGSANKFRLRTATMWSWAVWLLSFGILLVEPLLTLSAAQVLGGAGIALTFVQVRALTAIGSLVFEGR